jgi:hypothetical protein
MLKVTNEVSTYDEPAKPDIRVHSHWAMSDRVVIEIEGKTVTVIADDMIRAINNATNKGR